MLAWQAEIYEDAKDALNALENYGLELRLDRGKTHQAFDKLVEDVFSLKKSLYVYDFKSLSEELFNVFDFLVHQDRLSYEFNVHYSNLYALLEEIIKDYSE